MRWPRVPKKSNPTMKRQCAEPHLERVTMNRRRGLTVLAIAAALMVVVGAVSLLRRDDNGQSVKIDQAATTSTTANPTPGSVIPTTGPEPIWPFASTNRTFATPEEAAKSFAVDYLGMTHARGARRSRRTPPRGSRSLSQRPRERSNSRERRGATRSRLGRAECTGRQATVDQPLGARSLDIAHDGSGKSLASRPWSTAEPGCWTGTPQP